MKTNKKIYGLNDVTKDGAMTHIILNEKINLISYNRLFGKKTKKAIGKVIALKVGEESTDKYNNKDTNQFIIGM